jgi:anthranilate synthase component 2
VILLIDNYDSFTYNLYQGLAALGSEIEVRRNDAVTAREAVAMEPDAVVMSPGPGRPQDAGICLDVLALLPPSVPVLGVCLGHQCLVEHHGGALEVDPVPTHGKASPINHDGAGLFAGLPNPFPAGRYHSLRARTDRLPRSLRLTAWTDEGLVMGVQHHSAPRYGLQFHPESILTPLGGEVLARFLATVGPPSGGEKEAA